MLRGSLACVLLCLPSAPALAQAWGLVPAEAAEAAGPLNVDGLAEWAADRGEVWIPRCAWQPYRALLHLDDGTRRSAPALAEAAAAVLASVPTADYEALVGGGRLFVDGLPQAAADAVRAAWGSPWYPRGTTPPPVFGPAEGPLPAEAAVRRTLDVHRVAGLVASRVVVGFRPHLTASIIGPDGRAAYDAELGPRHDVLNLGYRDGERIAMRPTPRGDRALEAIASLPLLDCATNIDAEGPYPLAQLVRFIRCDTTLDVAPEYRDLQLWAPAGPVDSRTLKAAVADASGLVWHRLGDGSERLEAYPAGLGGGSPADLRMFFDDAMAAAGFAEELFPLQEFASTEQPEVVWEFDDLTPEQQEHLAERATSTSGQLYTWDERGGQFVRPGPRVTTAELAGRTVRFSSGVFVAVYNVVEVALDGEVVYWPGPGGAIQVPYREFGAAE